MYVCFLYVCVCVCVCVFPLTTNFSPDVELNYVGGADPEMIFLDASDKEVEVSTVCVCVCVCVCVYAFFVHVMVAVIMLMLPSIASIHYSGNLCNLKPLKSNILSILTIFYEVQSPY